MLDSVTVKAFIILPAIPALIANLSAFSAAAT
jgi:hypothetical protein